MTNTAFIYYAPHPAHKNFAESIGADFFPLLPKDRSPAQNGGIRAFQYIRSGLRFPHGYDNYLLEGGRTLLAAATYGILSDNSNIILLNADETFINVVDGLPHYGTGESIIHQICATQIDGLINVGNFVGNYAREAGINAPSRVVYPSVSDDLFDDLRQVRPTIGSKNIVSVAVGKPSVGFNILIDAFNIVRDNHPDMELHIAGRNHPSEWNDFEGVTVHGWVENLPDFFTRGELSVHPGRSECFPVSTLEPLCAGIPSIVSKMVGTKEIMKDIDTHLITAADASTVSEAIDWYFTLEKGTRRDIMKKSREIAVQFREDRCAQVFRRQFNDLVAELSE